MCASKQFLGVGLADDGADGDAYSDEILLAIACVPVVFYWLGSMREVTVVWSRDGWMPFAAVHASLGALFGIGHVAMFGLTDTHTAGTMLLALCAAAFLASKGCRSYVKRRASRVVRWSPATLLRTIATVSLRGGLTLHCVALATLRGTTLPASTGSSRRILSTILSTGPKRPDVIASLVAWGSDDRVSFLARFVLVWLVLACAGPIVKTMMGGRHPRKGEEGWKPRAQAGQRNRLKK